MEPLCPSIYCHLLLSLHPHRGAQGLRGRVRLMHIHPDLLTPGPGDFVGFLLSEAPRVILEQHKSVLDGDNVPASTRSVELELL